MKFYWVCSICLWLPSLVEVYSITLSLVVILRCILKSLSLVLFFFQFFFYCLLILKNQILFTCLLVFYWFFFTRKYSIIIYTDLCINELCTNLFTSGITDTLLVLLLVLLQCILVNS